MKDPKPFNTGPMHIIIVRYREALYYEDGTEDLEW